MKVTVAKTAGFCFGVKRAVDEVYSQIRNGEKPVCTYGPVIHNEQVMDELSRQGVRVINAAEEKGTLIIRAHGVPRRTQELLEQSGMKLVDATCPFVKKIHAIAEEKSRQGIPSSLPETLIIRRYRESADGPTDRSISSRRRKRWRRWNCRKAQGRFWSRRRHLIW